MRFTILTAIIGSATAARSHYPNKFDDMMTMSQVQDDPETINELMDLAQLGQNLHTEAEWLEIVNDISDSIEEENLRKHHEEQQNQSQSLIQAKPAEKPVEKAGDHSEESESGLSEDDDSDSESNHYTWPKQARQQNNSNLAQDDYFGFSQIMNHYASESEDESEVDREDDVSESDENAAQPNTLAQSLFSSERSESENESEVDREDDVSESDENAAQPNSLTQTLISSEHSESENESEVDREDDVSESDRNATQPNLFAQSLLSSEHPSESGSEVDREDDVSENEPSGSDQEGQEQA